jgi:hypothetical protein
MNINALLDITFTLRFLEILLGPSNPVIEYGLSSFLDREIQVGHLLSEIIERAPEWYIFVRPSLKRLLETLVNSLHRVLVCCQRLDPAL